jgi:hypothetical protein
METKISEAHCLEAFAVNDGWAGLVVLLLRDPHLKGCECIRISLSNSLTCWKVDSEAKMDPPIQTEYLRSGGAMI